MLYVKLALDDTQPAAEIMFQKCGGICGLWVFNEIIKKENVSKYEKNGSHLKVTC